MNPVDKQLEGYNTKNLELFLSCYSDDIEAYMLESNQLISKGKEQLKKQMDESFKTNPTSKTNLISRITQGDLIVDHEEVPNYTDGKTVKAVAIYEVKNDLITKIWFGGRTIE